MEIRELIFRGFHPCDGPDTIVVDGEKVKGRWVEGYIVKHPSAIQIGDDYSPWYIHVPPVDPDDNGGVFNVLPSTVGQYTGLTDRTGKRIFEGDTLRLSSYIKQMFPDAEDGPVKFSRGCFRVGGSFMGLFDVLADCEGGYVRGEVIGTVFDEEVQHDN